MRALYALVLLWPTAALADQINTYAPITKVTVHPEGAWITREVEVDIPAGDHVLTLPANFEAFEDIEQLNIDGVSTGAVWFNRQDTPLAPALESLAVTQARADLKSAQEALQNKRDQQAALLFPKAESEARLRFLSQLGANDSAAQLDAARLQSLIDLIGTASRSATEMSASAEIAARALDEEIKLATEAVTQASEHLDDLLAVKTGGRIVSVEVTAPEAATAKVLINYLSVNAGWSNFHEFHLTRDQGGALKIERDVLVRNWGQEAWTDVELVLSTTTPLSNSDPSNIWPQKRQIVKPEPAERLQRDIASVSGTRLEQPLMMEVAPQLVSDFDGINADFRYPSKVTVLRSGDPLTLPLSPLNWEVNEIFARAVPSLDETAFLMAEFTNTSDEPLFNLNGGALFFLEGKLVGASDVDTITVGQTETASFGPIDGLRISSTILEDNSGDRGLLRGRKIQSQKRRFDIENFTPEEWDIRILGRVPYSAQEDLEITWASSPAPQIENVGDRRGILRWDMTLAAGAESSITLEHQLNWPEDYELR